MNLIVAKRKISSNLVRIDIKAPGIASVNKPGHYIMVKVTKESIPFPVVISRSDENTGVISLLVHIIGLSYHSLASMEIGDKLEEVKGPYGTPIEGKKVGTVVCAAGGVGIVPLYPMVRAMKDAGNRVIVVLGASSSNYMLLEDEMRMIADELIIMTDDGSLGREGMVTDALQGIFYREKIDLVITSGPIKMIKYTSILTHKFSIPINATLYSINVNGHESTGIYKISVCSNSKYICVDGIDFNAYYPNFDTMIRRMESRLYSDHPGNQSYSKQSLVHY